MANRTWPVPEPKGWQHSEEFQKLYPTPEARRAFYDRRRRAYDYVSRGFCRVADIYGYFPEAFHGPRPLESVTDQVVELTKTTL